MQIDYSRFRIVAVVDWVELEVRTMKATQARHLHTAGVGLFSHAHGINPQTGEKYDEQVKNTVSTRFAVRIQAPERFASVTAALDAIRDRLDPSYAITVRGIEVALDAYAKDGSAAEELAEMAAHFLKGINRVSPKHPRSYRRKNETTAIASERDCAQELADDFHIGIGNSAGNRFQHIYLKTKDDQQHLPVNQHRARIEIRCQGDGCPVRTLEDLSCFDFSTLSDYFRFRVFDEPQTDLERLVAERQICLGNVIGDDGNLTAINRKGGGTRLNKRGTKASPLNEISRSRLRKLSERWQASAGRGKVRKAAGIACGNSACLNSFDMPAIQSEMTPPEQPETPRQFRGNSSPEAPPQDLPISTLENRLLNTSYTPALALTSSLAKPIKVVSGITPHTDLLPILHDLHQTGYPLLPDLTINQDET